MGNKGRWEYLGAIYGRYRPRPEKRRTQRERRRGLSYSQETLGLLTAVWEAASYPWSVRLKALLPAQSSANRIASRRYVPATAAAAI